MTIEFLLWVCLAFVIYAYAGYLLLLLALARLRARPVLRADITPTLSLIITVRNEEARIGHKISQSLELDYPREHFELIVASDCSTDRTHAIVESFQDRGVRLVISPERRGKEFAQKVAIEASSGEILVFSDAATQMDRDGLRTLARNFADPTVGCVSSVDRLIGADGQISGEGMYVRYEMLLRSLESSVGSVVGLSGSLFAARRRVCQAWAVNLPSDFTTLLNTLRLGQRGISDEASVGYYADLADKSREYNRKVRTITRGILGLLGNLHVLNPFRYGLAAWQVFSHKICRWLVPFALIGAFAANLSLLTHSRFYLASGIGQLLLYGIAAYGYRRQEGLSVITRTITFFVLANASILHAWVNVIRGRQIATWEPSRRPDTITAGKGP